MFARLFAVLIVCVAAAGCTRGGDESACYNSDAVKISRLELDVAAEASRSQGNWSSEFADAYRGALDAIAVSQADTARGRYMLERFAGSDYFRVFEPDVRKAFPDITQIETGINKSFGVLRSRVDSVSLPVEIYTYVSPYSQSVVTVDTVMLIALNHYLGENYPGYEGFEAYRRKLKVPERIVYDVAESVLCGNYPYREGAYSTALSRMLYEGAVVYVLMAVVPDAGLGAVLGYDDGQMKWCFENEKRIWNKLAADNLLYTSSKIDAARLVSPSPATAIVHPDAPGRLGRFIGYRIVESYVKKHGEIAFSKLLSPEFYDSESTLLQSDYRP